jgi:hypothetical protein
MYYSLYDKDFNALGVRKTYPCSSFSLAKKANEFDELVIEGVAIENNDNAMYVGLHNEHVQLNSLGELEKGGLLAIGFAGIPTTANGKTKIDAMDIRQLLNHDCVVDLRNVTTVIDLYRELLTCLFSGEYSYINMGVSVDEPDLTETISISFKSDAIESTELATGNVWNTIQAANNVYDCYVEVDVNFVSKRIRFKVKRISNLISIKLEDFDVSRTRRDNTKTNRAVCYAKGDYSTRLVYYLLNNDTVLPEQRVISDNILYPAVIEIFEEETLDKAVTKGVQKLYQNRFKASVEVPLDNKMGYLLQGIDLTYMVNVYEYKTLPVMEIHKDSKGKDKIKLGRLEEYWWV